MAALCIESIKTIDKSKLMSNDQSLRISDVSTTFVELEFLIRFVFESPRWLLFKQRYDEFRTIVRKMAQVNGKNLQEIEDMTEEKLVSLVTSLRGLCLLNSKCCTTCTGFLAGEVHGLH